MLYDNDISHSSIPVCRASRVYKEIKVFSVPLPLAIFLCLDLQKLVTDQSMTAMGTWPGEILKEMNLVMSKLG